MSRNSNRMSTPLDTPEVAPVTPTAQAPQDTVSRTSTVESVPLPSKGLFYPPEHPLHGQTHVDIRYMTARDEDILTSPSLLKQGTALDKFVQAILCDQRIRVDDLILGDKSAILIAARITGYGPEYEVSVTCPECETESEHTFELDDYEKYYTTSEVADGFELNSNGKYATTLPLSGMTVELKMVTSKEEARATKALEMKSKKNLRDTATTDFLKMIIHSIDGVTDRNEISRMVLDMPARDSRYLRKSYPKVVPNVEIKELFDCRYCGTETEMEVPLEGGFFWPDF